MSGWSETLTEFRVNRGECLSAEGGGWYRYERIEPQGPHDAFQLMLHEPSYPRGIAVGLIPRSHPRLAIHWMLESVDERCQRRCGSRVRQIGEIG
jgi:hypothetical protein